MRDLVFLDVETTGLDVGRHELLEVAALRVTWDLARPVCGPFVMKVRPERLEDADPRALDLVGYSDEEWRDAVSPEVMFGWLWPLLVEATPAGHNVGFDLEFLSRAAIVAGKGALPVDYHRLDTSSLAWLVTQTGESQSVSLQPTCDALGIERQRAHRALDDVYASLDVARRVRDVWANRRAFEQAVERARREGADLATIRDVITPRVGGDS